MQDVYIKQLINTGRDNMSDTDVAFAVGIVLGLPFWMFLGMFVVFILGAIERFCGLDF